MIVKKISKFTLLIALLGFGISLYALILHIQNLLSPGGGALCDISASVNCTSVIGSRYGEFAAIPLGAYGMAYFMIIFAAAITPKFAHMTKRQLATIELIIGLAGLGVVASLIVISYGVLKLVCPTCSIIHILVILYAVIKIYEFFKSRRVQNNQTTESQNSSQDALTRFCALAICLSIPPLLIGILTPWIVEYLKKQQSETPGQSQISTFESGVKETVHQDLMTFNKTNYVGNGEDYRRGSDDAPVIVQIFSDFGCPHCKIANEELIKAQDLVGEDKVLLVYRFYPLSGECNPTIEGRGYYKYNCQLVVATRCAGQQGKFWEFKEWAFNGQNWTSYERDQNFSVEGLQQEAKKLKMDTNLFDSCLKGNTEDAKIKSDVLLADQLKIKGTPLIFINGKEYTGSHNVDLFVQAFEQALK